MDKPMEFQLTKEFLELAFGKEVESFSTNLGTNPGDNYLSTIHAVEVIFKGEGDMKKNYLIKCYPVAPQLRAHVDNTKVFQKELFMYNEFLPELKKVMEDSGTEEGTQVGLSSAPFHGGNLAISPTKKWEGTPWAKENFLIMTDLRPSGFGMGDRFTGLTLEEATLVVKEMARWHAQSWAYKEKHGLTLISEKYPNLLDQTYSTGVKRMSLRKFFELVNDSALNMSGEALGEEHPAQLAFKRVLKESGDLTITLRKFSRPQGVAEEEFEEMLRIKPEVDPDYNTEPWITGTHGDCWLNNFLFRNDHSTGQPLQVTFVDLQLYKEVCPMFDLAYFFSTSIRAPLRIPNMDKLLQAYHDQLVISCKAFNVRTFPGFSMKSLKRRYRRAELFGLMVALALLPIVLKPKPAEGDSPRGKNPVVELADENQLYKEELVATLLDMYERGII